MVNREDEATQSVYMVQWARCEQGVVPGVERPVECRKDRELWRYRRVESKGLCGSWKKVVRAVDLQPCVRAAAGALERFPRSVLMIPSPL